MLLLFVIKYHPATTKSLFWENVLRQWRTVCFGPLGLPYPGGAAWPVVTRSWCLALLPAVMWSVTAAERGAACDRSSSSWTLREIKSGQQRPPSPSDAWHPPDPQHGLRNHHVQDRAPLPQLGVLGEIAVWISAVCRRKLVGGLRIHASAVCLCPVWTRWIVFILFLYFKSSFLFRMNVSPPVWTPAAVDASVHPSVHRAHVTPRSVEGPVDVLVGPGFSLSSSLLPPTFSADCVIQLYRNQCVCVCGKHTHDLSSPPKHVPSPSTF